MYRETRCGSCKEYGHNRTTCSVLLERAKLVEEALAEGGYSSVRQMAQTHWGESDTIATDWRAHRAYKEVEERKEKRKRRLGEGRSCGFCRLPGHNRKTCKVKVLRNAEQAKAKSYVHRFVASLLRASGCLPGALVRTRVNVYGDNYHKVGDTEAFGLLTGIDWAQLGSYDINVKNYPERDILSEICRRNTFFKVQWMTPAMAKGWTRYTNPPSTISLPTSVLLEDSEIWAGDYFLDSSVANCDNYEFHEVDYLGNDEEGCPSDFVLSLGGHAARSEKARALFNKAGVILENGMFDTSPLEILSFDERGR
jgi:hypothetical protein